jgi:hypothetical protein
MPVILLFPNFEKFVSWICCKKVSYKEEFMKVNLPSILHAELEEERYNQYL